MTPSADTAASPSRCPHPIAAVLIALGLTAWTAGGLIAGNAGDPIATAGNADRAAHGLATAAHSGTAIAQEYDITRISVDLALETDGSYRVEERIRFRYHDGTFSNGRRTIPLRGLDAIEAVRVTSPETAIRDLDHGAEGDMYVIRWSYPERSEPVTFVVEYRVRGALLEAEGENIIAWDPVGDAWDVPIGGMETVVSLPFDDLAADAITLEPAADAMLEPSGGDDGWTATFTAGRLDAGTSYGMRVRFPARLAGRPPSDLDGSGIVDGDVGRAIVAFLLGLVPGVIAMIRWRSPSAPGRARGDSPPDAPLRHVGYLLSADVMLRQHVMRRIFGATLVDLARRGRVTLRRTSGSDDGESGADEEEASETLEVDVHAMSAAPGEGIRSDFERAFLRQLDRYESYQEFQGEATGFLRDTYRTIRRELLTAGLLAEHRDRSKRLLVAGAFVLAGPLALALLLPGPISLAVAGLGLGGAAGAGLAAMRRYTRTQKGAEIRGDADVFLDGLRASIEDAGEREPAEAARLVAERLHWLLLDPRVNGAWLAEVEETLREGGVAREMPAWLRDAVGPRTDQDDAAALLPLYVVGLVTSPTGSSGTGVTGATSSVGVGASTGVGGGGGGVS